MNNGTQASSSGASSAAVSSLRAVSVLVLAAGAAASLALMWRAGRDNPSRLLILMFAAWVLAPFMALSLANVYSKRWRVGVQVPLHVASVIITVEPWPPTAGCCRCCAPRSPLPFSSSLRWSHGQ